MTSSLGLLNPHLTFKTVDSKMAEVIAAASGDKPLEALTAFFDFYKRACRTTGPYLPRQLQKRLLEICSTKDPLERTATIQAAFRTQFPPKVEVLKSCDWRAFKVVTETAEKLQCSEMIQRGILAIKVGAQKFVLIPEDHEEPSCISLAGSFYDCVNLNLLALFKESIPRNSKSEQAYKRVFNVKQDGWLVGLEAPHTKSVMAFLITYLEVCSIKIQEDIERDSSTEDFKADRVPLREVYGTPQLVTQLFKKIAQEFNCEVHAQELWQEIFKKGALSKKSLSLYHSFTGFLKKDPTQELGSDFETMLNKHSNLEIFQLLYELAHFAVDKYADRYSSEELSSIKEILTEPEKPVKISAVHRCIDLLCPSRERHFAEVLLNPPIDIPPDVVRIVITGLKHTPKVVEEMRKCLAESQTESKGDGKAAQTEFKGAGAKKA